MLAAVRCEGLVQLCDGCGSIVERRGEGDDSDDRKSVGVVDEGIANVVIDED